MFIVYKINRILEAVLYNRRLLNSVPFVGQDLDIRC